MRKSPLSVYSEIGRLKKVLLHRPGAEIENLTPDLMERLLFDDIPYLEVAREEHDAFANIFRENGVEVYYLEQMMAEVLMAESVKEQFLDQFISEAGLKSESQVQLVKNYLKALASDQAMVDHMMAGIRKEELDLSASGTLEDLASGHYPFVIDPMPNLYFTRDPFATMGSGASVNHMYTVTRNRETIFADYILKYHPMFKDSDLKHYYERNAEYSIEGGDMLVLSEKVIAIGISERTEANAIELFAQNIFASEEPFETILAIDIPKVRAFMHLDTVFTMIDKDLFTIHPDIEGPLKVFSLKKDESEKGYHIKTETETLDLVLSKYLGVPKVDLLRCGGKMGIDAGREQWNDGSNTLAIGPREVIVYSRNHVTNALLEEAGVKIHKMPSSELSRGRGGPRCMSMPLEREPYTF